MDYFSAISLDFNPLQRSQGLERLITLYDYMAGSDRLDVPNLRALIEGNFACFQEDALKDCALLMRTHNDAGPLYALVFQINNCVSSCLPKTQNPAYHSANASPKRNPSSTESSPASSPDRLLARGRKISNLSYG